MAKSKEILEEEANEISEEEVVTTSTIKEEVTILDHTIIEEVEIMLDLLAKEEEEVIFIKEEQILIVFSFHYGKFGHKAVDCRFNPQVNVAKTSIKILVRTLI